MEYPLISVIVPVYKVEAYLDACVQSIVDQTYKNLEIILVDDGSPDQCPQMCDGWAKKDPRIMVIHKKNGGASTARNAALDIARGEYVGFIDSDDYIAENMYEELLQAIKSSGKGIACCSALAVSENGKVLSKKSVPDKRVMDIDQALDAIFYLQADVSVWSKLYDRTIFEHLRFPEGETNEDFPVTVPSVVKAQGMVHVQQYLYYYRQRGGSVTTTGHNSEKKSLLLYHNLQLMKKQLMDFEIVHRRSFRFFSAQYAFYRGLAVEKTYPDLSDKLKKDSFKYRKIMQENMLVFLFSRHSSVKDKFLYLLVLTRLLRPIYKVCYKNHL